MSEPSFAAPEAGALRYLQALRRHWVLIATLCLLAVAAASLSTYTATKRYTSVADLLVRPLSPNDNTYQGFNSVFQQNLDGSSAVVTAARVIGSPEVKAPCLAALPPSGRGATIHLQPLGQADVIEIQAEASVPERAASAANAFAACTVQNRTDAYQAEVKAKIAQIRTRIAAIPQDSRQGNFEFAALQQSLATYSSSLGSTNPTIDVLTRAAVPLSPVWPRPKLALAASLLIALLLGVAIALILEFVSPRIGREDELQLQQRLPILARVPRLSGATGRGYLTGRKPLPPQTWKSYRVLRAVLANAGREGGYPRTILLTSAMPGDGKTTTAINLALTLAAADLKVVLVDADIHRPMVSSFFNVAAHRNGFSALLAGEATPRDILVDAPLDARLKLVLAGHSPGGYAGMTAARFREALERLEAIADVVVVDCPPLPEVAEVLEMASAAEVVVLAVRLGRTRRDKLIEVRELLARRGITPAGFVVTTRDPVERETSYDYPGEPAPPARSIAQLQRESSSRRIGTARRNG